MGQETNLWEYDWNLREREAGVNTRVHLPEQAQVVCYGTFAF